MPEDRGVGLTRVGDVRPPPWSWWMVLAPAGVVTALNAVWYFGPEFPRTTPMSVLFLVMGTLAFWVSARLAVGFAFTDLSPDARIVAVMTVLLASSVLMIGRNPTVRTLLGREILGFENRGLVSFSTLSISSILFLTVAPLAAIVFVHRSSPIEFGFGVPRRMRSAWVYPVLFTLLIPIVWHAAARWDYLARYPQAGGLIADGRIDPGAFLVFELLYAGLVVSGECFWRGYVTFGLRRELGYLALVYMAMLYSIAHYGKPFSETMAAAVTGVVLGVLALRYGSLWLGCLLHLGVAFTMELVAIFRQGVTFR